MHSNTQNGQQEPLLTVPSVRLKSPHNDNNGLSFRDDQYTPLIETEDVSFFGMVWWLFWKNYKSQCERRKLSWIIKMLIPVVFTLVLAALRTAFNVTTEDVDYGLYVNNPIAIIPQTTSSNYWAPLTLCDNTTNNSAFFIAIVPPYGSNPYIDNVIDKLNQSWSYKGEPNTTNLRNQRCIDYVASLPFSEGWIIKYFDSSTDVDNYCKDQNYGRGYNISGDINDKSQHNRPIGFGITFNIPTGNGTEYSYRLRFNASGGSTGIQPGQGPPQFGASSQWPVPSTNQNNINNFNRALRDQWTQGSSNYAYSSFINIQAFVDNAIMEAIADASGSNPWNSVNHTIKNMTKGYFAFPSAQYSTDGFWSTLEGLFVFFILISFVYPFSQIVKALVEEKAAKIKEGLKMMGATFWTFWVSWYLWFFLEFIIMAVCFTFLGKWLHVFMYSDVSVIFVWMVLFCINLVTYATLVSTIFDNPKVASLIGVFIFIIALYGGFFGLIMNGSQKNALCLLGPSCYSMSLTNLAQYEASLIGLQWDNINDEYQEFKFSTSIWMLLFDSILYILLTLYMDKVFPSRYGQRQSPIFICLPRFWCPKKHNMATQQVDRKFTLEDTDCFEPLGSRMDLNPAISIRKLTKHFTSLMSNKTVRAVNGMSMDIFSGEVFCLLGHNGAGKTTTINMLTGLIEITSGDAWILGNNVHNGMQTIRKTLGVCPQHDVLFKRLTVREHLELFCRLKGVPSALISDEVDRTINSIGIKDKENEFPPNLSGGQKRKLSLGIALIGGSKIVFLDEPTSGMDPQSRRVTWDLIAKEKRNRCIILTTHFMDEADILADRIAIMSTGYLRCCGSALFLKRLYGVGYTFTISLNIDINPLQCKREIDAVVLASVEGSSTISVAGGEIAYRLPFEETASFPHVFESLDKVKQELGISTYGISITTLEEVFLKIGEEHRAEIEGADEGESESTDNTDNTDNLFSDADTDTLFGNIDADEKNDDIKVDDNEQTLAEQHGSGYEHIGEVFPQPTFQLLNKSEITIFFEHFFAILYRRWFWGIRDFRALCCQILLPGYFAAVGLIILKLTQTVKNPNLVLNTDQFYGNNAGLNGYVVPYTNISAYDSQQPFAVGSSWMDTYDDVFANRSGYIEYVTLDNTALFNSTPFQDWLLTHYAMDDKYHYNAFWTSNGSYIYNPFNRYIPPILVPLNNTIQCGINLTAIHALPIVYNLVNNWIAKELINSKASIEVSSHPLVVTSNEKAISDSFSGIFASIYLMIAFAFIPVGAIYNIVLDKSKLTKHQQLVSGISFVSYWIGNFVADLIAAIPAMVIVYILIHAFDVDVYLGEAQGPFLLVLIVFTCSILPFTYILSYLFTAPDKAQTVVGTIYLILGMILLIVSFVLDQINDQTKQINDALENVYRIFPTFLMADGLFQIAVKPLAAQFGVDNSYYAWDITGRDLTLMAVECIAYFIVVLFIEWVLASPDILSSLGFITNCGDECDEVLDDDVENEMKRIQQLLRGDSYASSINSVNNVSHQDDYVEMKRNIDTVVLAGLRKVYKGANGRAPNVAVRDVYLGVPQGQVFGYLGVNGAGKTTTLACLTGERFKSSGEAFIHGIPISNQMACRRFIGYCPQSDALFELLTGKEHLRFYGMLKGLRGQDLKDQVNLLLRVLSLTKYKNRKAGTYSGGNKRKLSVAISMIGNPPVVFLDEPSTGMDPMARRSMWEFIRETMQGRCVLLTTHSMEECEALCHKLGIMVKGQLRCLGTPQHLKSKFGSGYQLDLTLDNEDEKTYAEVEEQLNMVFDLRLIERNQSKITYELSNEDRTELDNDKPTTLAQMFRRLEDFKQTLPIVSYALNQTTLEQIFIRMAKKYDAVSEF